MSGCEAPGLPEAAPSPAALVPNPAMAAAAAAAAAVAAVGSAGRPPPAAVVAAVVAVADVLPVEAPPCTSSVTPVSPVVLCPAAGKLGMKDVCDDDSCLGDSNCYRQAEAYLTCCLPEEGCLKPGELVE